MMSNLFELDSWSLFFVLLGVLFVSVEVGHALGAWRATAYDSHVKARMGNLQTGALGTVALILGFAFAVSLVRFDDRRKLVVQEANDIGAAYVRCQILPSPDREHCASLLLHYIDLRLEIFEQRKEHGGVSAPAWLEVNALHGELWGMAVRESRRAPEPVVGLFVRAIHNLIDANASRVGALKSHVSRMAMWVLFSFVTLGLAGSCFAATVGRNSRISRWYALAALLASLLLLIYDLDRPVRGAIPVDHAAMYYQRAVMH